MKCCKIVSVWFGDRRSEFNSPIRPADQIEFFIEHFMEHEKTVDPGVDMDLIIVNNIGPKLRGKRKYMDPEWDHFKPFDRVDIPKDIHLANKCIYELDGTEINRGTVKVLRRLNSLGRGFDGFAHGFASVCDDYDYFFFIEDDVVFFRDHYYKMGVDTLENNQPVAQCVGYSPKSYNTHTHFGGGLILSSRQKLKDMAEKWVEMHISRMPKGSVKKTLPNYSEIAPRLPDNEVSFSNAFNHSGNRGASIDQKLIYCRRNRPVCQKLSAGRWPSTSR